MLSRRPLLAAMGATLAGATPLRRAAAQAGVSADRVLFGQACALEGPAASLGRGMRAGIAAAFAEVNRAGGVHGRTLELATRDDGYEPARSIEATRALIEQDRVFALIGPVGTPTSQAAQPLAQEAGLPFIAPFTGAEFLRDPKLANVVNLRASYFQETEVMVERLTKDLGAQRIAILYQDDAFGRAGLEGVKRALGRRSMELAAEGTYERNTLAVRGAVLAIQRGRPDAVIMIGAYAPCAQFIKTARQLRMAGTFVNISFVGSDALARELGPAGEGVVITQVVPFPRDASIPLVRDYQAALAAQDAAAEPGFVSLEGYAAGRLAAAALARLPAGAAPTREGLLRALLGGGEPYDLGGMRIAFQPGSNQGSDTVWLTVLQADGSFRPVTRLGPTAG